MLPASKLGKINTFARPGTGEPGAFFWPTASTCAASNCSSPSMMRPGARCLASCVASRTRRTRECSALPLVLNDNIATMGTSPVSIRCVSAEVVAMMANCFISGAGTTAQSANVRVVPVGNTIKKTLLTRPDASARPITRSPACNTRVVGWAAPATHPSA